MHELQINRSGTDKVNGRLVRRMSLTIAAVVTLAALLLGAAGLYFEWASVNEGFAQRLKAMTSVVALQVDGDAFSTIKSDADAQSDAYQRIAALLAAVRKDQDLPYAYTVVLKNGVPVLVVDGSEEREPVGTAFDPAPPLQEMYETGKPAVTGITNEDDYGRLKTGYAPIRNKKGEIVGAVALDLQAEVIYTTMIRDGAIYIGVWLVVTAGAILFGMRASRAIGSRITPLSVGARALATGDLSARFDGKAPARPDEVDELRASLGAMQANLVGLVNDLRSGAGHVVEATGTLVNAVESVSRLTREADQAMSRVASGTEQQAASAAQVAGFFAQFTESLNALTQAADSQARLVAQAAEEAADIAAVTEQVVAAASTAAAAAAETAGAAQAGTLAVAETATAVEQITGTVTQAAEGMQRLSGQASHIGQISSTIRELAEQSNLLALNAAIEAARAGEHGRGFAVVADEVRKLAGRSAQSADQITQILDAVRHDIDATLVQVNDGFTGLTEGSRKAARAREALAAIEQNAQRTREEIERVVADSTRNAAIAREIGVKAREAARQVLQSTEGAQQVASGSRRAQDEVQNVAAIAEETADLAGNTQRLMSDLSRTAANVQASVESLLATSQELERATGRFQR